jgi:TIR domain
LSRLFISHSSANNAAAIALAKWLSEQGYNDLYLDIDPDRGTAPGERWQQALKAAADRCEAVLFLVSPAWLDSKWCLAEFLLAKALDKRIFGLIIEPVPFERVPGEMTAEWQLCDLTGEDGLRTFEIGAKRGRVAFREVGLDLLLRGLKRSGLDAKSFPWPPSDEPKRAPFRGLRALEPQDAAIFFGRDAAIVRALDRIRGLVKVGVVKLLVALGASGSGKSSFLRAGLWPRLGRDDVNFLPLPVIRPQTAVINGSEGLAVALSGEFERLGDPRTPGRIKEALAQGSDAFGRLLDELSGQAKCRHVSVDAIKADPAIILSLDQAEELFNPDGAVEAKEFLELVAGVLAPADGVPARPLLLIATMRSDRYELLQSDPRLSAIKQDLFNLPPLPPAEFKSVIERPLGAWSKAAVGLPSIRR